MAQYQNHVSFSFLVGAAYVGTGYTFFNIYPENLLLALVVFILAIKFDIINHGGV